MDKVEYVLNNYYSFTSKEGLFLKTILLASKIKTQNLDKDSPILKLKKQINWEFENSKLLDCLKQGENSTKSWYVDQLIANYKDQIHFNHCPNCNTITRTPKAKQCQNCFHKWH